MTVIFWIAFIRTQSGLHQEAAFTFRTRFLRSRRGSPWQPSTRARLNSAAGVLSATPDTTINKDAINDTTTNRYCIVKDLKEICTFTRLVV